MALKDFFKKLRKKSQKSAQQAYSKKKAAEAKTPKRAASSNYDRVRQKAQPKITKPSGSSGGSSYRSGGSSQSSWGSRQTGGTTQHRSGSQGSKSRPQATKKANQTSWQSYVQKTLKSQKSASQKSALNAYEKMAGNRTNALGTKSKVRTGGGVRSRDLSSEDYLKMNNAIRMGLHTTGDKKLDKRIGSRTAYSANRNTASRISTGFMQGLAPADVLEGGVGTYSKKARKAVDEAKKSTSFNIGYGAGQMAGFALGGTSGAAKSLVQGGAKAAGKAAAKSTGKKFAKNRAAEVAVETPMNIADAVKMARDEDGKVNRKKLAGYMALNTGLTAGAGAVMEGAAIKFTKKNADELIKLQAKANKGSITKEEGQKLTKLYDKLDKARKDTTRADSNIASEGYRKGKNAEMEGITERYRPDAEKKMQTAKNVKKYKDLRANEKARTQKKLDAEAERYAASPEGQRAIADARVKELDDQIEALRNSGGSKQQKLRNKKEAGRLERERNKLLADTKGDIDSVRYKATSKEYDEANIRISNDEARLEQLKKRQSYSTNPSSKGFAKRQKQIDNLEAKIKADKEALEKYTVSDGVGTPRSEAPAEPKAKPVTTKDDAIIPETKQTAEPAKAEPKAEPTEKGATKAEPTDVKERISARETYNDADKNLKAYAGRVVDSAPEQAEVVAKHLDDYDDLGKKIAANKAKAKNSKTPAHIEKYNKEIRKFEEQQKEIVKKVKTLDDTYVSKYGDGESVLKDIDPTDSKEVKRGKTGASKFDKVRRLMESSLIEFEKQAKRTGNQKLLNAVNNVIYARNKAGAWVETARSSFNSRTPQGKSLNQIFKDAGAFKDKRTRADFNTYALLRHHIDRVQADKPIFMKDGQALSIPDAKKAMIELESKYGKEKLETFSDELTAYSNDLLKYRLDAGLITKETYDNAMKYEHYVPSYRIKEDNGAFVYEEPSGVTIEGALRGAVGGDSEVEDLYSQLYKITNDVISSAEQNEMVKLYAQDMGLKVDQISKNATLEDLETARVKAGKDGTISFYSNGQRMTLKANDQAVKGLREWNSQDYALITNACAKLGHYTGMRIFKGLITDWNIAFGVRNGARDFQQAIVNSKDTKYFFKSMPQAIHAVLPTSKNNAFRKLYEINGGKYYSPSGDPMKMKDPTKTNLFDKIVSPMETFNGMIEMNPRMAEFIGTINKEADKILKGKKSSLKDLRKQAEEIVNANPPKDKSEIPGAIEDKYAEMVCKLVGKDTIDRAMRNAADITLNFSRHGAFGKALNSGVVPYFNPSIQGLSKTIRLFTEGKADKALLNICMKLGTLTIAPALFNEYMMRNNRDYQDLNTRDKDNTFFIPIGDGKFIKIPKPRENAVLAEPLTYGLRYFFDKAQVGSIKPGEYSSPENWKQMFITAKDNIGPVSPLSSNYFSPIINTALNKTWYGGNIESISDQEKPVNERQDETTSALAIMLGDSKALKEFQKSNFAQSGVGNLIASNLSPKKIDNLMDSYFGVIYDMGIKPTAANRDTGTLQGNIGNYFAGQFILDGVYSNKLATDYYTKMDKLNEGAKDGEMTPKKRAFMDEYGYDAMNYSTARADVFSKDDKDFAKMPQKERLEYARNLKKAQNDVYRGAINGEKHIFGTFENNFKNDPYKVMARELKKTSFEKTSGKMAEEKVLNDMTFTDKKGKNTIRDAFDEYKDSETFKGGKKEKEVKKFFNDTVRIRGLLGEASANKSFITWTSAALVAAERNRKAGDNSHTDVAKAYGASEDTRTEANNYIGFDYTLEDYAQSHGTLEKMARREGKNLSDEDDNKKTIALAKKKYTDGSYYIEGKYIDYKKNYARCIVNDGMTSKEYNKWMDDNDLHSYVKGKSKEENYGKSSEEEVINAIEKDYGDRSREFKAAMYRMFYDYGENPYGEVGDYSLKGDRGLEHDRDYYGGYGGRGRRRYGRRGYRRRGYGGYGGGGYGGSPSMDWNTYVGNIFTSQPEKPKAQAKEKVHDYTKKSELTEAYRRRAQNKQTIKNKKA